MVLKRSLGLALMVVVTAVWACAAGPAQHVITISVDGMGASYMQNLIDAGKLPNMLRLRTEGAATINARTDYDFTITLPNHTCMVTSRRVTGPEGHNWTINTDPKPGQTLHSNKGSHVASAFEVAHDAGLSTGMWATKTKFSLFRDSCKVAEAAESQADRMDIFSRKDNALTLTADFLQQMQQKPLNYAFVHFGDTDAAGHSKGWGGEEYNAAMIRIDGCIGQILDLIASTDSLRGTTAIIMTADHGGEGTDHGDATKPIDYTIPFVTWGAGVDQGDLYTMNPTRQDPGTTRPTYAEPKQPVRNGDAGNLAMRLLGLKAIPGSMIGNTLDLQTQNTTPAQPAQPAQRIVPAPTPTTQPARQAA